MRLLLPESDIKNFKRTMGGSPSRAPAPVFLSRGQAAEVLLGRVVEWWQARFPLEVRSYLQEVNYLRENMRDGTGMAITKSYAQVGTIPARVHCLVERLVPGFWESGGSKLWFELFPKFASRSKKMGHFRGV